MEFALQHPLEACTNLEEFKELDNALRHRVVLLGCPVHGQGLDFDDPCGFLPARAIPQFCDSRCVCLKS